MYGLVLEGGGSRGAYQAGAVKALCEMGIEFSCVAGTSVGALNGSMVVQNEVDRLWEIWYDIDPSKVIRLTEDELEKINSGNFSFLIQGIRKIIRERGLDVEPLSQMIKVYVDEDKVRNSSIDFGIVTFELTERKPIEIYKEQIPEGKLTEYLIASATFPGFKPKNIDGGIYLDGAIYNVLPINMVMDKGCSDIIAIRTFGFGRIKKVETEGMNITEIAPSESLGFTMNFNTELSRKNLQMGYFDAYKKLKGLKGRKYYVKPLNSEEPYINYFLSLNESKIRHLAELFGITEGSPRRLLFEVIIPRIAELTGMTVEDNYEDLSICLIEYAAEQAGVDRFRIYTVEELFNKTLESYKPLNNDFIKAIPGFLRRIDVVSKINKDRLISSLTAELLDKLF